MRAATPRRLPPAPPRGPRGPRGPHAAPPGQRRRLSARYNHFVGGGPVPAAPPAPGGFRLAVKDNIATAGLPTTCASRMLAGHASPFEATVVRQLRACGAVVVGKTNMDEFGMGSHSASSAHGAVRNPLSPDVDADPLSAGGSSGGSAVAVVVGDADVALGTDTGGSVRLPAAYTGAVGYRPSYAMVSRHGVVPYANSLDTVGFLARRAAPLLDLLRRARLDAEHDACDPTSLPPAARRRCTAARRPALPPDSRLAVGVPLECNVAELHPAIRRAWAAAAAALEARGVRVVPVSLPSTRAALCAYYVLAAAEASSNLAKYDAVRYGPPPPPPPPAATREPSAALYADARATGLGDEVRRRILLGTYSLSSAAMDNYFVQAQRVRRLVRRDMDRVLRLANPLLPPAASEFDLCDMPAPDDDDAAAQLADKRGPPQVDFLLCPTAPTFAPPLRAVAARSSLDAYVNDVFTVPASLAGLPAASVPVPAPGSPLPAGLQLIGQYWDDQRLLAMAERLMEVMEEQGEEPCAPTGDWQ